MSRAYVLPSHFSSQAMAEVRNVCCLCGDIGFPDKLFQCLRCIYRFQHSYCSNYYHEEPAARICDWCRSEESHASRSRQSAGSGARERVGRQGNDRDDGSAGGSRGRSTGGSTSSSSSAKHAGRRYKLLKDVMC